MKTLTRFVAVLALLGLSPVLSAQTLDLVVDDYNDGDNSEYFQFSGGEASVISSTAVTPDGSAFAFQFETDADEFGGFTGFGRPVPGAPYNTSGLVNPYLSFDLSANVPMTVEINLQTAGDTESRNALQLAGDGTYRRYTLPFSSFLQSQANPFDPTMLNNVVFAIVNIVGDGNPATFESVLRLDNLEIYDAGSATIANDIVVEDFESGDLSPYFFFGGGEFIAASTTASTPDGSSFAFHGEVDGDEYGGFAGFGRTIAGAPIDASGASAFNFWIRASGPGVLEINLQSDAAAGGNEGRDAINVGDTGGAYRLISIPIDAFLQTTPAPYNPAATFNFVITAVQLAGDGNPATAEFVFDIDALGFSGTSPIPVELTDFTATQVADGVTLNWATASETNNAGFEVQQRQDGTWNALGFVTGAGTTTEAQTYSHTVAGMAPGTHAFRLKQIDFDGTFAYSDEVEVTVGVPGTHVVSAAYPNPFNPQATFTLAVARAQNVQVALYDALGRQVATLLNDRLEADALQTVRIDGAGLSSGIYVVRVTGETFSSSQRISLLR